MKMKRTRVLSASGRCAVIPALIQHLDRIHYVAIPAFLALALCSPGCGSSDGKAADGAQASAKGESRFRIEGTGKNKQQVLIRRRDERIKKLQESVKNQG